MSVNKKVDEKELKKVAGGGNVDGNEIISCPSCGYCNDANIFQKEYIDEGCTHYRRITCPKCGHVWTD